MRLALGLRLVFLRERFGCLAYVGTDMPEYGEVVVAGIVEYAGLYVTITLDGVVVHTAKLSLSIVIILDVHTHLFVVAFQRSEYVDRQGEADIAVYGGVLAQRAVAHLA